MNVNKEILINIIYLKRLLNMIDMSEVFIKTLCYRKMKQFGLNDLNLFLFVFIVIIKSLYS